MNKDKWLLIPLVLTIAGIQYAPDLMQTLSQALLVLLVVGLVFMLTGLREVAQDVFHGIRRWTRGRTRLARVPHSKADAELLAFLERRTGPVGRLVTRPAGRAR